jgi:hypothetical protein
MESWVSSPAPLITLGVLLTFSTEYMNQQVKAQDARQATYTHDYLALLTSSNFATGFMNSIQMGHGMLQGSFLRRGF